MLIVSKLSLNNKLVNLCLKIKVDNIKSKSQIDLDSVGNIYSTNRMEQTKQNRSEGSKALNTNDKTKTQRSFSNYITGRMLIIRVCVYKF